MSSDINRVSYDRIAAQWDEARSTIRDRERRYLDALVARLPPAAEVLDLGCGTGRPIAEYLLSLGHKVTGVDQAANLLELARRRLPSAMWVESSLEAYQPTQTFDAVVCWDALFHIPRQAHQQILARAVGCLKPGGRLMLTVGGSAGSAFTDTMFGEPFFYDSHTPHETLALLATLNCAPVEADFINLPDGQRDKGRFAIVAERNHQ